jgi:hypothetical protein
VETIVLGSRLEQETFRRESSHFEAIAEVLNQVSYDSVSVQASKLSTLRKTLTVDLCQCIGVRPHPNDTAFLLWLGVREEEDMVPES